MNTMNRFHNAVPILVHTGSLVQKETELTMSVYNAQIRVSRKLTPSVIITRCYFVLGSECNIVIEANTTLEDSPMPIGAVVGGIGGALLLVGLLAIVLLVVAIIVYIKRRKNNNDNFRCHVLGDNLSNGTETEHGQSRV